MTEVTFRPFYISAAEQCENNILFEYIYILSFTLKKGWSWSLRHGTGEEF